MKNKYPKFNKKKCRKCIYSLRRGESTLCNYLSICGQSCLHMENGVVVDSRGEEYNNCKLYVKGAPIHEDKII